MNNDTVNETWIDKLVDELVDAKNEKTDLSVAVTELRGYKDQFDMFIEIVLNNSRLDYDGEGLRIKNEEPIFEYLRVLYPVSYAKTLSALKAEREAELKKLADAKAKESKGKKEA